LISLPKRSNSALFIAANCSTEMFPGSPPRPRSLAWTSGSASTRFNSAASLSTTGLGVPAVTYIAYQVVISAAG